MQPHSTTTDDRQDIIDAAYGCLSEPHSGAIPVAAILERAGLSTRAFYRHFTSKDELFLAMLCQEADALADRLDSIPEEAPGHPVKQLTAWIEVMFELAQDPQLRTHLSVIDSDEVRAAKGYRETRERLHADRARSLEQILACGRDNGVFPLADPQRDAMAISAVVSRSLTVSAPGGADELEAARAHVLDFALRALGGPRRR
ncbi:TetR/AcrR family transcriptional regulator [Mycolicibacterium agri]|uniref:TetR/AcrR family transcriptional regulator n=1 Tax=Mycolicibacterium agri TaxID=36811 RepID=UPI001F169593|nr:TetR/AcrR family transcriptional regulator [Mycolicibacterium agri]